MRLLLLAPALMLPAALIAAPAGPTATQLEQRADLKPLGAMPLLDPNAGAPAACPPISRYHAQQQGKTPGAQKLGELPAADMYLSVYRQIDGCEAPIIASYGLGRQR